MPTKTLAYILGGGKGTRLYPLTRDRAKPAVHFGAMYRVIDFVLTNLYHSGIRKVVVPTQYESRSLERHIFGWSHRFGHGGSEFLRALPPRQGASNDWYKATADAITQNLGFIEDEKPHVVDVFGGDHIYLMDISAMNESHLDSGADLTLCAMPVKRELAAGNYGVLAVNDNWELVRFDEKPSDPEPMPGNEEYCLASMGNYAFNPAALLRELVADADKLTSDDRASVLDDPERLSSHDFGFDVIPAMLRQGRRIFVYNFMENSVPGVHSNLRDYWRDIGNLDQFYAANMELRMDSPPLDLYNDEWRMLTAHMEHPLPTRYGTNLIGNGSVISSGTVEDSVLSWVHIEDGAAVKGSILQGDPLKPIRVGKGAVIQNAILDTGVLVADGVEIGVDKEHDRERGFEISPGGITAVPRMTRIQD